MAIIKHNLEKVHRLENENIYISSMKDIELVNLFGYKSLEELLDSHLVVWNKDMDLLITHLTNEAYSFSGIDGIIQDFKNKKIQFYHLQDKDIFVKFSSYGFQKTVSTNGYFNKSTKELLKCDEVMEETLEEMLLWDAGRFSIFNITTIKDVIEEVRNKTLISSKYKKITYIKQTNGKYGAIFE